ncbi:hypothetical protein CEUSTIGMA_g1809.t1 [Chlamydomonas eustigma]|uniref:Uncharacterized protein n=1 Tax=Chlamydomonas eustigma TaxID=1157962 RepID=A0A250WUZ2_9CHLO|nr:hypothetical protein CEUSTIGMA_g1809.t1 [Chlamydomonas eustigma]|eukprot:GAX74360.1 hypothetical protein CEUSTIGMA_g1809.t1 [Chlamydomonas eustigma]
MLDAELQVAKAEQEKVYFRQKGEFLKRAKEAAGVSGTWRAPSSNKQPQRRPSDTDHLDYGSHGGGSNEIMNDEEAGGVAESQVEGYLGDGDLEMYSQEMLTKRERFKTHPGIMQAIQAWWDWMPKDVEEVEFEVKEDIDPTTVAALPPASSPPVISSGRPPPTHHHSSTTHTTNQKKKHLVLSGSPSSSLDPLLYGSASGHNTSYSLAVAESATSSATSTARIASKNREGSATVSSSTYSTATGTGKTSSPSTAVLKRKTPRKVKQTVRGVIKPVYCALVSVIQQLLLPRYGLEPDPDYDPESDWLEDQGDRPGPMLYPHFFDALFQLADLWVDSAVAWDYAALLADLLAEVQEQERESFMFSRVMDKYGYIPYYPDWIQMGPQFVIPRAIEEPDRAEIMKEDEALDNQLLDEATAEEQRLEEQEEQRAAEMMGEDEEETDELDSEEEREIVREKGGAIIDAMLRAPLPASKQSKKPAGLKPATASTVPGAKAPKPSSPPSKGAYHLVHTMFKARAKVPAKQAMSPFSARTKPQAITHEQPPQSFPSGTRGFSKKPSWRLCIKRRRSSRPPPQPVFNFHDLYLVLPRYVRYSDNLPDRSPGYRIASTLSTRHSSKQQGLPKSQQQPATTDEAHNENYMDTANQSRSSQLPTAMRSKSSSRSVSPDLAAGGGACRQSSYDIDEPDPPHPILSDRNQEDSSGRRHVVMTSGGSPPASPTHHSGSSRFHSPTSQRPIPHPRPAAVLLLHPPEPYMVISPWDSDLPSSHTRNVNTPNSVNTPPPKLSQAFIQRPPSSRTSRTAGSQFTLTTSSAQHSSQNATTASRPDATVDTVCVSPDCTSHLDMLIRHTSDPHDTHRLIHTQHSGPLGQRQPPSSHRASTDHARDASTANASGAAFSFLTSTMQEDRNKLTKYTWDFVRGKIRASSYSSSSGTADTILGVTAPAPHPQSATANSATHHSSYSSSSGTTADTILGVKAPAPHPQSVTANSATLLVASHINPAAAMLTSPIAMLQTSGDVKLAVSRDDGSRRHSIKTRDRDRGLPSSSQGQACSAASISSHIRNESESLLLSLPTTSSQLPHRQPHQNMPSFRPTSTSSQSSKKMTKHQQGTTLSPVLELPSLLMNLSNGRSSSRRRHLMSQGRPPSSSSISRVASPYGQQQITMSTTSEQRQNGHHSTLVKKMLLDQLKMEPHPSCPSTAPAWQPWRRVSATSPATAATGPTADPSFFLMKSSAAFRSSPSSSAFQQQAHYLGESDAATRPSDDQLSTSPKISSHHHDVNSKLRCSVTCPASRSLVGAGSNNAVIVSSSMKSLSRKLQPNSSGGTAGSTALVLQRGLGDSRKKAAGGLSLLKDKGPRDMTAAASSLPDISERQAAHLVANELEAPKHAGALSSGGPADPKQYSTAGTEGEDKDQDHIELLDRLVSPWLSSRLSRAVAASKTMPLLINHHTTSQSPRSTTATYSSHSNHTRTTRSNGPLTGALRTTGSHSHHDNDSTAFKRPDAATELKAAGHHHVLSSLAAAAAAGDHDMDPEAYEAPSADLAAAAAADLAVLAAPQWPKSSRFGLIPAGSQGLMPDDINNNSMIIMPPQSSHHHQLINHDATPEQYLADLQQVVAVGRGGADESTGELFPVMSMCDMMDDNGQQQLYSPPHSSIAAAAAACWPQDCSKVSNRSRPRRGSRGTTSSAVLHPAGHGNASRRPAIAFSSAWLEQSIPTTSRPSASSQQQLGDMFLNTSSSSAVLMSQMPKMPQQYPAASSDHQFGLYNWAVMEANFRTIESTLLKALQ